MVVLATVASRAAMMINVSNLTVKNNISKKPRENCQAQDTVNPKKMLNPVS